MTPHSAIREGDFKFIFDWYGRLILYDIENDPLEKNDLSKSSPEQTKELFSKLKGWIKENIDKHSGPHWTQATMQKKK